FSDVVWAETLRPAPPALVNVQVIPDSGIRIQWDGAPVWASHVAASLWAVDNGQRGEGRGRVLASSPAPGSALMAWTDAFWDGYTALSDTFRIRLYSRRVLGSDGQRVLTSGWGPDSVDVAVVTRSGHGVPHVRCGGEMVVPLYPGGIPGDGFLVERTRWDTLLGDSVWQVVDTVWQRTAPQWVDSTAGNPGGNFVHYRIRGVRRLGVQQREVVSSQATDVGIAGTDGWIPAAAGRSGHGLVRDAAGVLYTAVPLGELWPLASQAPLCGGDPIYITHPLAHPPILQQHGDTLFVLAPLRDGRLSLRIRVGQTWQGPPQYHPTGSQTPPKALDAVVDVQGRLWIFYILPGDSTTLRYTVYEQGRFNPVHTYQKSYGSGEYVLNAVSAALTSGQVAAAVAAYKPVDKTHRVVDVLTFARPDSLAQVQSLGGESWVQHPYRGIRAVGLDPGVAVVMVAPGDSTAAAHVNLQITGRSGGAVMNGAYTLCDLGAAVGHLFLLCAPEGGAALRPPQLRVFRQRDLQEVHRDSLALYSHHALHSLHLHLRTQYFGAGQYQVTGHILRSDSLGVYVPNVFSRLESKSLGLYRWPNIRRDITAGRKPGRREEATLQGQGGGWRLGDRTVRVEDNRLIYGTLGAGEQQIFAADSLRGIALRYRAPVLSVHLEANHLGQWEAVVFEDTLSNPPQDLSFYVSLGTLRPTPYTWHRSGAVGTGSEAQDIGDSLHYAFRIEGGPDPLRIRLSAHNLKEEARIYRLQPGSCPPRTWILPAHAAEVWTLTVPRSCLEGDTLLSLAFHPGDTLGPLTLRSIAFLDRVSVGPPPAQPTGWRGNPDPNTGASRPPFRFRKEVFQREGVVAFEGIAPAPVTLELRDVLGRRIRRITFPAGQKQIRWDPGVPAGVYWLKIQVGKHVKRYRLFTLQGKHPRH
ncbi:MAG: T9SS type A sorting domain-containing protein, partial [Candidatus Hydrothermae bacterium]|nr:T9SS type A sorting domain-containing protein [Candidatus Hydrothermae bacterium]